MSSNGRGRNWSRKDRQNKKVEQGGRQGDWSHQNDMAGNVAFLAFYRNCGQIFFLPVDR